MSMNNKEVAVVEGASDVLWAIEVDGVELTRVRPGESVVVGRKPIRPMVETEATRRVDIDDPEKSMSKRHAKLSVDSYGRAILEDLGSTNGSFVVRDDGALMRVPLGTQITFQRSPMHLQFGDKPIDFREVSSDETGEHPVASLFDNLSPEDIAAAANGAMSVDQILDVRAGEPTTAFDAGAVRGRVHDLDTSGLSQGYVTASPDTPATASSAQTVDSRAAAFAATTPVAARSAEPSTTRTAVSNTAVSNTAVPNTAVPDTAVPGIAVPDAAASNPATSGATVPDSSVPAVSVPATSAPVASAPDAVGQMPAASDDFARTAPETTPVVTAHLTANTDANTAAVETDAAGTAAAEAAAPNAMETNAAQTNSAASDADPFYRSSQTQSVTTEPQQTLMRQDASEQDVRFRPAQTEFAQSQPVRTQSVQAQEQPEQADVAASRQTQTYAGQGSYHGYGAGFADGTESSADDARFMPTGEQAQAFEPDAAGVAQESHPVAEQASAADARFASHQMPQRDASPQEDDSPSFSVPVTNPHYDAGSVLDRLSRGEYPTAQQQVDDERVIDGFTIREARGTADYERQFEIAQHDELLPFLAMNPRLYGDLYAWLEAMSNADVKAALDANAGYKSWKLRK